MSKELNIIIAGKNGVGKSTIAAEISQFLKSKGMKVYLDDEGYDKVDIKNQSVRLDCIKKEIEIRIKTVKVSRTLEKIYA